MDLQDASLKPPGWDEEKPPENKNYQHPADMSVYELHIRDFSVSDAGVAEEHRGKYTAFSQNGFGSSHLKVAFLVISDIDNTPCYQHVYICCLRDNIVLILHKKGKT